jgi:nucleotide-sensitive chloride channel 1A
MLNFMLEEPSADEEDLDKVEEEGGMNGVEEGGLSSIEVRIVPEDLSKLSEMYSAVSYCQGLHPDPDLSSDSEEDMDHEMMDMLEGGVSEDHPSQEGECLCSRMCFLVVQKQ